MFTRRLLAIVLFTLFAACGDEESDPANNTNNSNNANANNAAGLTCGDQTCDPAVEYCIEELATSTFRCATTPDGCDSCACVNDDAIAQYDNCYEDRIRCAGTAGALTVECYAPAD